ncbi:MAG: MogA/MoaB family molybdenum cofactor biosynthesis protein [Oscillospiraceae bacterium]|nr:MogA/MoaB family molybdenum cofactor biosynthesis protein [Oscillospiraceae bacterium]
MLRVPSDAGKNFVALAQKISISGLLKINKDELLRYINNDRINISEDLLNSGELDYKNNIKLNPNNIIDISAEQFYDFITTREINDGKVENVKVDTIGNTAKAIVYFRWIDVKTSGPNLVEILKSKGFEVTYTSIIPDEREMIKAELCKCADELGIALVLTTGGTGFSPRDITPEAAMDIIERPTPGIPEAMRAESMRITPKGCLSRSVAGIRKRTLIITLPGSKKASQENILAVIDPVAHGLDMLYSEGSADCAK